MDSLICYAARTIILKFINITKTIWPAVSLSPAASTTNQRWHYKECIYCWVLAHHSYCLQLDHEIGGFRTGSDKRRVLMNVTTEHITLCLIPQLSGGCRSRIPTRQLRHLSPLPLYIKPISPKRNEGGRRLLAAPCATDRTFDPVHCS